MIIAHSIILLAIPIAFVALLPDSPTWLAAVVALTAPVLVVKLVDSHIGIEQWRQMTLAQWLAYLANIYVLCYRRHLREPPRPLRAKLLPLIRGLVEVAAGAILLRWAYTHDVARFGFWIEHIIKLLGLYLLVFDGWFVFVTGALRLSGSNVMDQSRHPILATTPADFWRRYNRDPGRFFFENVFKPAGALHHPVRGIFTVFIINGMLHEYLASLLVGRVTGCLLAYFLLHAMAVALTWRLRPRGPAAFIAWLLTLAFLIITAVLAFAPPDMVIPFFYENEVPSWLMPIRGICAGCSGPTST